MKVKRGNIFFLILLIFISGVFFAGTQTAEAATLFLSPASGSFAKGRTFTVSVYVASSDQAMNAVSGIISFPHDKLEVVSLSKVGSIITQWMPGEPGFSNTAGTIHFEGIIFNPGFKGKQGKILGITFKAKNTGTANLSVSDASVLANDGMGTPIFSGASGANLTITAAVTRETAAGTVGTPTTVKISSSPQPSPQNWYSSSKITLSWFLPHDTTAVRLLLNQRSNSVPTVLYRTPIAEKKLTKLEEGRWYFHVQLQNDNGWGKVTHFPLNIDLTPPEDFSITVNNEGDSNNINPLLLFQTTDALSGIDRYEINISGMDTLTVKPSQLEDGGYRMESIVPGTYSLTVKAFDKAGNYATAERELTINPSAIVITSYPANLYLGNPLVLKGTAYPNTDLTIFIQDQQKQIITTHCQSDGDGHWAFISTRGFEQGSYTVWVATEEENVSPQLSDKILITVSLPVFFKAGRIIISYRNLVIILVLIIILIGTAFIYSWRKIKQLQKYFPRSEGSSFWSTFSLPKRQQRNKEKSSSTPAYSSEKQKKKKNFQVFGVLSVSSSSVEVDEPFNLTIQAYDKQGIDEVLVWYHKKWHSQSCFGRSSVNKTFSIMESKKGHYTYYGCIYGRNTDGTPEERSTVPEAVHITVR